jgi:hypothetical protein
MLATDLDDHERIVREALRLVSEMDLQQSPPAIAQLIHRQLKKILGMEDPYKEEKHRQNELALHLVPEYREKILSASDPLMTAARFAIAGNIIDLGADHNLAGEDIRKNIHKSLTDPFSGDRESFCDSVNKAKRILYIADNAGEIAFDRLLIEQLPASKVILAVRGAPILNDATIDDAHAVGLDKMVKIIDTGSDAPGILLDDCSSEFLKYYHDADLVISKGQGNFESLSDESHSIFFLFKVKCSVISAHVGYPVGRHLMISSNTEFSNRINVNFGSTKNIGRRTSSVVHFA